jgi:hypothetical protein
MVTERYLPKNNYIKENIIEEKVGAASPLA